MEGNAKQRPRNTSSLNDVECKIKISRDGGMEFFSVVELPEPLVFGSPLCMIPATGFTRRWRAFRQFYVKEMIFD